MHVLHLALDVSAHPRIARSFVWVLSTQSLSKIRLVIVSGVRLVREGLVSALRARRHLGVAVIGCVGFSEDDAAKLPELRPDVILIDLAHLNGMTAARTLRRVCPTSKLIGFSVTDANEPTLICSVTGLSTCVPHETSIDELLWVVANVRSAWTIWLPQSSAVTAGWLASMRTDPDPVDATSVLTTREQQVLTLSNKGFSNKEIANTLKISPSTAKNHMHNILQKLKVDSRGKAAALLRAV